MVNSLESIVDFHRLMDAENVVLVYEGEFNQEITKGVLAMSEKNFSSENVTLTVRKKVFNVMVEALQNICKHQYTDNVIYKKAIFIIGETEKDIVVMTGNVIKAENVPGTKEKLDLINSLDKDGLKALFKDLRVKSTLSDVGGAGLGFVDMARKSGNTLEYGFEAISDGMFYFALNCRISKTEEAD